MKKPVIVISPEAQSKKVGDWDMSIYCSSQKYVRELESRGAIAIIPAFLSPEDADQLMSIADGLFMTGGADVDPARYGEEVQPYCGALEKDRDESDWNLMAAATKHKKPIFSVCRGSQYTNVFFGGTLYQDLPTQHPSDIKHVDLAGAFGQDSHIVNIVPGTPLHKLLGKDSIGVNTTHHQGYKTLGEKLVPMAYAPDGLVESFYLDDPDHWVRCYQWHPELMTFNENMDALISDFVNAVKENMNK